MGVGLSERPTREPSAVEARSHVYGLFARLFSHPDTELLDSIVNGEFLEALLEVANYLPYPSPFSGDTSRLMTAIHDRAEIEVFYTSAFEAGQTGISLRESAYSKKSEAEILEDTFRFYEHFGLNFSKAELSQLPDGLPVELEFMHYLVYLQTQSRDVGTVNGLIQGQHDFLTRHLLNWVPSLGKALNERADGRFYNELNVLLHSFLLLDQQFLQETG